MEDYLEKLSKSLRFLSSAFSFAAPQDNSIEFKFLNFKPLIAEEKKKSLKEKTYQRRGILLSTDI